MTLHGCVTVICALSYWLVGYGLAYGGGGCGFYGKEYFAGVGMPDGQVSVWFFQYIFAATAATIISGAVAERCNFVAYLFYSAVVSGKNSQVESTHVGPQGAEKRGRLRRGRGGGTLRRED